MQVKRTVELTAIPDGTYWLRVLDEDTGELAEPQYGPYTKEDVPGGLATFGLSDEAAKELISLAEINYKAKVPGIIRSNEG